MSVQLFDLHEKIDKCDFLLKWKKPSDNGSSIKRYTVYLRTVKEIGPVQLWENIHSTPAQEYHVVNSERGKVYEFKVKARNIKGEGEEDRNYFKKVKVEAGK